MFKKSFFSPHLPSLPTGFLIFPLELQAISLVCFKRKGKKKKPNIVGINVLLKVQKNHALTLKQSL
jgi:hypothetical protein